MIVEKLRPEAMEGFVADPRIGFKPICGLWDALADKGWAWSVAFDDGRIAGACGLYRHDEENPRIAEMWAVFSSNAGPLMPGVTRRTLAVLEAARGQLDLIRACVSRSFPQGRKWVLLLGFEPSGESLSADDGAVHDYFVWKG